jgi:nicotinamidase-related amidase
MAALSEFENHCWKDLISAEDLKLYSYYARETFVGPSPALLLIDFYNECFRGGPFSPYDLMDRYPSTCGIFAHRTIEPTQRLIAAARAASLPIFYCTGEDRPQSKPKSKTSKVEVTNRRRTISEPDDYEIHPSLAPQPDDVVIHKQRASVFQGTPLLFQLNALGIESLIVGGGSASGCLRAGVVDAQAHGFHVSVVEECVFDRAEIPLKANLFDLGHKYVDVMHIDEVVAHLESMSLAQAAE